jgi:hypothetical protein
MKSNPVNQYLSVREQLLNERICIKQRLAQINEVLGGVSVKSTPASAAIPRVMSRPALPHVQHPSNTMTIRDALIKAIAKGPLARHELVNAVAATGYVFGSDDPLNSMGLILYGKNSPFVKKDGKFALPNHQMAA